MDRFIEGIELNHPKLSTFLKSNMDRFIAFSECELVIPYCFKIQYG